MNKIIKSIYIIIGLIAFGLGALGVILPILPTTPFLLLASFCFVKGSDKFNIWFINTKIYKKYLEDFVNKRAMTLKEKICILAIADFMLAFPLIMIDSIHMKIFIVCLILLKFYYFMFRIKTIKS